MLLARNMYDEKLDIAFKEGLKLKNDHIDRISKMGYPGAYILDACANDVTPEPIIPEEMYVGLVKAARGYLLKARDDKDMKVTVSEEEHREVVMPVIEALKSRQKLIVETIDIKPFAGYDYFHATQVMLLSLLVGIKLNLEDRQLYDLAVSSLLHDVGNAFLPEDILNRPGVLTDEEFAMVKQHVQKGVDYMKNSYNLSPTACLGALQHHENYDGTGYPDNLKRKKISLFGRIIAIADVYDALVSKRAFRVAMYPYQALEVVEQRADRKFDPDIVALLGSVLAPYPTGVLVDLKSGERCIVSRNHYNDIKRPRLTLYDGRRPRYEYIDLHSDPAHAKTRIIRIVE